MHSSFCWTRHQILSWSIVYLGAIHLFLDLKPKARLGAQLTCSLARALALNSTVPWPLASKYTPMSNLWAAACSHLTPVAVITTSHPISPLRTQLTRGSHSCAWVRHECPVIDSLLVAHMCASPQSGQPSDEQYSGALATYTSRI